MSINLDDFLGKIDDMLYRPVDAVCKFIEEPLNFFEHRRNLKTMDRAAKIEADKRQQEAELAVFTARKEAELQADQKRWDAEINEMIAEQEARRRNELVESIKRYQIELATASREIVNSIGLMSIELRRQANDLVQERTAVYRKMQQTATDEAMKKLEKIQQRFAKNESVRTRMEDSVINQMNSIIHSAEKFIDELAEDLKRLNQNTDTLTQKSMDSVNRYLDPMAKALQANPTLSTGEAKKIEENIVIDTEATTV